MSLSDANDERTSRVTLVRECGFVRRRYVTPESSVAVVSDPAFSRTVDVP
jgi:hypothetical protein